MRCDVCACSISICCSTKFDSIDPDHELSQVQQTHATRLAKQRERARLNREKKERRRQQQAQSGANNSTTATDAAEQSAHDGESVSELLDVLHMEQHEHDDAGDEHADTSDVKEDSTPVTSTSVLASIAPAAPSSPASLALAASLTLFSGTLTHDLHFTSAYHDYRSDDASAATATATATADATPDVKTDDVAHTETSHEPEFTNYTASFKDCLDYILYQQHPHGTHTTAVTDTSHPSSTLHRRALRALANRTEASKHTAYPSIVHPSDHLMLAVEFVWNRSRQS